MMLTCYCCGESYERGYFKCCAPPKGTPSHVWLGQHCSVCKPAELRSRCPRHCTCERITPYEKTIRPLAQLAKEAAASLLSPERRLRDLSLAIGAPEPVEAREWMAYREPGEDD